MESYLELILREVGDAVHKIKREEIQGLAESLMHADRIFVDGAEKPFGGGGICYASYSDGIGRNDCRVSYDNGHPARGSVFGMQRIGRYTCSGGAYKKGPSLRRIYGTHNG